MTDDTSNSRPSIRAAGRGDADALLTLVVDVLDADDPDPVHGPWTRHLLDLPGAPAVVGGAGGVVVAERDGALLGCAWLLPQPLVVYGRPVDAVQLEQVAVVADQRGKGLARRLIQAALQQARAGGADVVLVRGDPQLYTRLGFRPAIERPAATRIRSDRLAALAVKAIPTRPATPADAALLARWDAAAKGWLLRRTRTTSLAT